MSPPLRPTFYCVATVSHNNNNNNNNIGNSTCERCARLLPSTTSPSPATAAECNSISNRSSNNNNNSIIALRCSDCASSSRQHCAASTSCSTRYDDTTLSALSNTPQLALTATT